MQLAPRTTVLGVLTTAWLAIMYVLWVAAPPINNIGAPPYGLFVPVRAFNVRWLWFIDCLVYDDVHIWVRKTALYLTIGLSAAITIVMGFMYKPFVRTVSLRRMHSRLDRSECPACGYSLGEHVPQGCPECGWGRPED